MSDEKYVAIGDIHGCYESMIALLEKLEPYNDRKFIFIGDYIDRGPASQKVVEHLIGLQQELDCVFLRGNHEQMLLDAYGDEQVKLWLMNGGRSTLRSYGRKDLSEQLPSQHQKFYEQTKFYYDTKDYFFVHGGVSPAITIEQSLQKEEVQDYLWERSHLNAFETPWEKTVVFGHTPRPHPINKEKMIGIDTGCVYDRTGYGKLTAVKLPEEEFVQQVCLDRK